MPFNGAGVYSAPAADFPAVTQTVISSTHYNNVINDIATGLSLCLTKDGQQTATANIPFGGFRATNIGITAVAGSAAAPAINVSDTQTGLYRSAASELAVTVAGTQRARFDSTGLIITGAASISTTLTASTSVVTPLVGTDAAATVLSFKTAGTTRWNIDYASNGTLYPATDNTIAIGYPGSRVSNVFTPVIDSGTTGSLSFKTNNGNEGFRVNHNTGTGLLTVFNGGAGTTNLRADSSGADANVSILYGTKGAGTHQFYTDGLVSSVTQFQVLHTASATRNITVTGSNGGNPTIGVTAGSLAITPDIVAAASLSVGTTPSTAGNLRVPYSGQLSARNSANSGNQTLVQIVTVNGQTDVVRIGGGIYSADGPGSVQFFARNHAGAPTTSDIPAGNCMVWDDTTGVTVKLYYNNGAALKSVALT